MEWPEKWRDQPGLMLIAFVDFLLFVVTQTDFAYEWQKRTGKKLPTKISTPLEALIDKACGHDGSRSPVLDEFVQAVYVEMWAGDPESAQQG